ncbi:MAG: RnfABCDGE type electron transport complex subunit B [bacterium]|jgi:electron transport complex protein RnfB
MKRPAIALIDEARCIGCTRCIDACPVDAIVGAEQMMHTVIAAYCTGCALCLPPCPVDCIAMISARADQPWTEAAARAAKARGAARKRRLSAAQRALAAGARPARDRRRVLDDAIARARSRRAHRGGPRR